MVQVQRIVRHKAGAQCQQQPVSVFMNFTLATWEQSGGTNISSASSLPAPGSCQLLHRGRLATEECLYEPVSAGWESTVQPPRPSLGSLADAQVSGPLCLWVSQLLSIATSHPWPGPRLRCHFALLHDHFAQAGLPGVITTS